MEQRIIWKAGSPNPLVIQTDSDRPWGKLLCFHMKNVGIDFKDSFQLPTFFLLEKVTIFSVDQRP